MSMSLLAGIVVTDNAKAQNIAKPVASDKSALTRYAWDLTSAAAQGRFDSLTERREETTRAIEILSGANKNNPVVLTDSQAIRDLVASGVARRIAKGDVPEALYGKRLFKLNLEALFHDSKSASELVNNISAILSEIAQSDSKIILLVDPIQSLMGPSAAFDGAVSGMLRDAIKNGDVQCLGASTDIAFQENVASQESLAPLFASVEMQEVADAKADQATNKSSEEFVGEKVSSDLREYLDSGKAPARVNVILQVDDANSSMLQAQLAKYGVNIAARMPQFGALAVDVPSKAVEELANNSQTRHISLDRTVQSFGHVQTTTGESAMLSQNGNSGLDGSGVGIAILDSGISKTHHTVTSRVVYSQDFTGEGRTDDPYGHGTFVAAMAAGKDTDYSGTYSGVATAAKLVNLRVLDSHGKGTVSAVLSALDAVMAKRSTYNIRVVNMSLGMPAVDSYKNDPICRAVRTLVDSGIVVIAAAGNDGKDALHPKVYGRIHSPGIEPSAITVGAANTFGTDARSDDGVTTYSSRGPTRSFWKDGRGNKHYDNLIKPDMVAPGNKIMGAAANNNALLGANPLLSVVTGTDKGEMKMSGTSAAAPMVAGAAAVLLEANPNLTPNMVKMILMYTAQPLAKFNMFEQGAGELNIEGAIRLGRLVRTDLSPTTTVGSPLLTSAAPSPRPSSPTFSAHPRRMPFRSTPELFQLLGQLRQGLIEVRHQSVVGDLKDRCFLILVDRHDDLRILHAGEVLDGTRNADSYVQIRCHHLARLTDLPVVGRVASINGGSGGADGGAELVGKREDDFLKLLQRAERATPSDDDSGRSELRSSVFGEPILDEGRQAWIGGGLDDPGTSLERLLMNWFLRAEGSDLTDEALRDKETMGDDDTVDAPVSPLTTGPRQPPKQQPITRDSQRKAQRLLGQIVTAMTSADYLETRHPADLAKDLRLAALVIRMGRSKGWLTVRRCHLRKLQGVGAPLCERWRGRPRRQACRGPIRH
jgi:subtilisin family serine protease